MALDLNLNDRGPYTSITSMVKFLIFAYFLFVITRRLYHAYFGPLSKFPGPRLNALWSLPYLGVMWRGEEASKLIEWHEKYGEAVRIAPDRLSFVGNAETWKDVYGFKKAGQNSFVKDPFFFTAAPNGSYELASAPESIHGRQRRVVSHAFSEKALKEQEPLLKGWAKLLLQKLGQESERGEEIDMVKMLNCTTFDIMADLTFAESLGMLENSEYVPWVKTIFGSIRVATLIRCFRALGALANQFISGVVLNSPMFHKQQAEHWRFTCDRVDRRLSKTPDRPDLWSRILEKDKASGGLERGEHYSNAALFMLAGTETTATALSGTLYHLLQNPDKMDKLKAEIRTSFEKFDDLHLESLVRCEYMNAVLKEGMRMYPPVPIGLPRAAPKGGALVQGQFVPEGTTVYVHQLASYRVKSNWKNPEQFVPERWLGDPEYEHDVRSALEPFSVGPRTCMGKNLAWHEMRLLLSGILLTFDFELCEASKSWANQKAWVLWDKPELLCKLTKAKA